jgi:carotenoid cleavage dioxygenase-like enzyme
MHSFGMSEHYVVLAEYPLVADVHAIAERKRESVGIERSRQRDGLRRLRWPSPV